MRLIFVRHCDPYYPTDSLTEKGFKEAKLLSKRIKKWNILKAYSSPMGRAFTTAKIGLSKNKYLKTGEITVCPWLREFNYPVVDPLTNKNRASWDLLPEFFTSEKNRDLFDFATWQNNEFLETGDIKSFYKTVCDGLDGILEEFDYKRNGLLYSTVRKEGQSDFMERSTDVFKDYIDDRTVVIFCHLVVMGAMLSHLLNISAPSLWQGFFVAPSSVTILNSEERTPGIASWRVQQMGDTAHLYAKKEPPSSSGYFASAFEY